MEDKIALRIKFTELGANKDRIHTLQTNLIKQVQDENLVIGTQNWNTNPLFEQEKSDLVTTMGVVFLITAPTLLPQLIQLLQGWVVERRKVSIEAPNGAKIEFTANKKMTNEEIIELVKKLNKIQPSNVHPKRN